MSWLSSTFSGGNYENPADKAMPYLEQVPDTVSKYFDPYIDLGMQQGNQAANTYSSMVSDPAAFYNNLVGGYESSDYYKYQQDELSDQMAANAAAGGYTGTEQDMQNQAEMTQGLLSKDEQQYYNNLMQLLTGGLGGEQQNYMTGYNASSKAEDDLVSNLNAEAGLAYKGQSNENAYNQSNTNSFLKGLGNTAGTAAYLWG